MWPIRNVGSFGVFPQEIVDKMPEGYIHAGKRCYRWKAEVSRQIQTKISVKYILARVTVIYACPCLVQPEIDVIRDMEQTQNFWVMPHR